MDITPHLYLVDGSAYIFRAYHRLPPLTNPSGVPVGAVYGYTTMLWKLAEDLHKADGPTHLAVILDASGKSFRNDIFPEYKANRPPPPEDLKPQFPLIRDATRAFSLPCIEEMGLEADDLIASYAHAATERGWRVTIVSSDKDLMQLVGPAESHGRSGGGYIDMLDTMKNVRIDIPEVHEKFGVEPALVGDVLALMGDSVDNVPGIRGIGPKTATKLIQEHGSLEAALAAAPGMKAGKLRESLIEQAEMARLSRVLVQLKEDCALPLPLDDLKLDAIPPDPLAGFLSEHGFTSLLKRLGDGRGSPERKVDLNPAKPVTAGAALAPGEEGSRQSLPDVPPVDLSAYQCVQTREALEKWIERAFAARLVAFDTETSALDAMQADLVGVSLALGPNDACYIPLGHGGTDMFAEKPQQIDRDEALRLLKPLLESDAVLKIGQNAKYDLNVLARHGIAVAPLDDTMVMSFDLDAGRSIDGIGGGHGMDELAQRHLGHTCISFKEVCGTGQKAISFAEVPVGRATEYAAEDADVTWRLHRLFAHRLPEEGGTRIYQRVDRPLVPVVAQMERHGIKVDRDRLAGLSAAFASEIAKLDQAKLAATTKNSEETQAKLKAEAAAEAAEVQAKLAATTKNSEETQAKLKAEAEAAAAEAQAKLAAASKASEEVQARLKAEAEANVAKAKAEAEAAAAEAAKAAQETLAKAKAEAEAALAEAKAATEAEAKKAKNLAYSEFSARYGLLENRFRAKLITEAEFKEQLAQLRKELGL